MNENENRPSTKDDRNRNRNHRTAAVRRDGDRQHYDAGELKASVDLEELARALSHGEGRHDQTNAWFRCPMPNHDDRNPSFTVLRGGSHWRCWSCGASGSGPIDLVMAVHALDFPAAVQWLGERHGGTHTPAQTPTINRRPQPRTERLEERADHGRARRVSFGRGSQYRAQLVRERRWTDEIGDSRITQFGIELVELNRYGRTELRWRFPFLYRGRVVAWQDRAVSARTEPKWLTSPGGLEVPYNVDRLAADDRPAVVICEGPADVVTFAELRRSFTPGAFPVVLGFPGAQFTKRQWLDALREDGRPVIVLADNDEAGDTMRRRFVDELGDQVLADVRVPERHNDLGDWWTTEGHGNDDARARLVADLEQAWRRHGNS